MCKGVRKIHLLSIVNFSDGHVQKTMVNNISIIFIWFTMLSANVLSMILVSWGILASFDYSDFLILFNLYSVYTYIKVQLPQLLEQIQHCSNIQPQFLMMKRICSVYCYKTHKISLQLFRCAAHGLVKGSPCFNLFTILHNLQFLRCSIISMASQNATL
jgi:hypothetical protein